MVSLVTAEVNALVRFTYWSTATISKRHGFNRPRTSQDGRRKCCAVVDTLILEGCKRVIVSNRLE